MQYDGLTSTTTPHNSSWGETTTIVEQRGATSSSGDTLAGDCADATGPMDSKVILIYQSDIDDPANQAGTSTPAPSQSGRRGDHRALPGFCCGLAQIGRVGGVVDVALIEQQVGAVQILEAVGDVGTQAVPRNLRLVTLLECDGAARPQRTERLGRRQAVVLQTPIGHRP